MKKNIKKIGWIVVLISTLYLCFYLTQDSFAAGCSYSGGDLLTNLDGCLSNVNGMISAGSATDIDGNITTLKEQIIKWNNTLAGFFGLIAVGALIYGAFQLVFSTGEDEKVNSAKKTIKWSLLGFLAILLASGLVRIVVALIYNYAG